MKWIVFAWGLGLWAGDQGVELRFDSARQMVVASGDGVAAALAGNAPEDLLAIHVEGSPPGSPDVGGEYTVTRDAVSFRPRYPLRPGVPYRAVWAHGAVTLMFQAPAATPAAATIVQHVFPSADRLPENQLKFYIYFSASMSQREAYRRVHLIDESGAAVSLPFLELDEELWDPDRRRLTLLFDPGRIKRGLLPREEAGGVLVPGRRYTFSIDRDWPDAEGRPLKEGFTRSFVAIEADRKPVDPAKWRLRTPKEATIEPLVVNFREPLDQALALRLIEVLDPSGRLVEGEAELAKQESSWRFAPRLPWQPGRYSLRIATTLEDLAGNRVGRLFDVDRFERVSPNTEPGHVLLRFWISARRVQ